MPLVLLHCALASLAALALHKWLYPRPSLPVVGIGPSHPLFNLPSRIASVFKSKTWIDTGYQLVRAWFPPSQDHSNSLQHSRQNKPFMVSSLLEEPSLVVLPPSMTTELILAKETDLSFWHALDDIVFSEHAFYSTRILSLPLQTTIIRRHLASGAQRFMPDVVGQLRNTLDREWGSGKPKQWRSVNLFDSLLNVVNNMVSVVFVGTDLGMGLYSNSIAKLLIYIRSQRPGLSDEYHQTHRASLFYNDCTQVCSSKAKKLDLSNHPAISRQIQNGG